MLIGTEPLDLRLTLVDSAQCFRWTEAGGRFGAVLEGGPVWLRRTAAGVEAEGEFDPAALRRYLDLERDYAALAAEYEMSLALGWRTFTFSTLLTFGVSLLVGWMVARKNRKINMVEALKGQE